MPAAAATIEKAAAAVPGTADDSDVSRDARDELAAPGGLHAALGHPEHAADEHRAQPREHPLAHARDGDARPRGRRGLGDDRPREQEQRHAQAA
jgi:hypothetical protein